MKNMMLFIAIIGGAVLLIGAIMWWSNSVLSTLTPITVHIVAPDVMCAKAVTSHGVALSCWHVVDI